MEPITVVDLAPPDPSGGGNSAVGAYTPRVGLFGFLEALSFCWARALAVGMACATLATIGSWRILPHPPAQVTATLRLHGATPDEIADRRQALAALAALPEKHPEGCDVHVEALPGDPHVRLSLKGEPVAEKALLVNAMAEGLVREFTTAERRERNTRLAEAETEAQRAHEALQIPIQRLRMLLPDGDLEDLRPRQAEIQDRLTEARKDLRQASLARANLELERTRIQTRPQAPLPPASSSPLEENDELLRRLREEQRRIQGEIGQIRRVAQPGTRPKNLEQAESDLADVVRQIQERRQSLIGIAPRQAPAEEAPLDLAHQVEDARQREHLLQGNLRTLEGEAKTLGTLIREVQQARDERTRANLEVQQTQTLVERRRAEVAAPTCVTAEQWAEPPVTNLPARLIASAGTALVGVVVVLLGYGLQEYRMRRVRAAEEVQRVCGLRLFGRLPHAPATVKRRLAGLSPQQGDPGTRLLSEALDAVRTRLLYEGETRELAVILVTSAVSGEGKTSLASQLAISLARAWRRTLLVDADMRKPGAHRQFGLPLEPGLSEVLRGEVQAEAVLHATPISRLWAVPSGRLDDHALQALAQDVGPLIAEWKGQYDFVIIDCPPVLPVADALMLGRHVHGVLLSVLCGESRLPLVHEASVRLSELGVPILGAVVAGIQSDVQGLYDTRETLTPKKPAA